MIKTKLKHKMLEYIVTKDSRQRLMLLLQVISVAAAMTPEQFKKEFPGEAAVTMAQQMPVGENVMSVFNEYARHHELFLRFLELYHLHVRELEK